MVLVTRQQKSTYLESNTSSSGLVSGKLLAGSLITTINIFGFSIDVSIKKLLMVGFFFGPGVFAGAQHVSTSVLDGIHPGSLVPWIGNSTSSPYRWWWCWISCLLDLRSSVWHVSRITTTWFPTCPESLTFRSFLLCILVILTVFSLANYQYTQLSNGVDYIEKVIAGIPASNVNANQTYEILLNLPDMPLKQLDHLIVSFISFFRSPSMWNIWPDLTESKHVCNSTSSPTGWKSEYLSVWLSTAPFWLQVFCPSDIIVTLRRSNSHLDILLLSGVFTLHHLYVYPT